MITRATASKIALVNCQTRIKARIARIATMPKKKILWVISRSFMLRSHHEYLWRAGDRSPALSKRKV
jgi:hypothetical protein